MPEPVSDCRRCKEQFPSEDLSSDGFCLTCYDITLGWEKNPLSRRLVLTDEERKAHRKEQKRIYRTSNKEKIAAEQRRRLRANLKQGD